MELVQMLTSQLGVNEAQAQGGAGLLFKMAKDKLSSGDFGQIAEAVPGIENLISAAPEAGGIAGALGGLASAVGGGGKLGDLAALAGGFKNLDLDAGMIEKFVPVIVSFLETKGGDTVKALLANVLK